MKKFEDYVKEEIALKRLKSEVDEFCQEILGGGVSEERFNKRKEELRELCKALFPDKVELFELIYGSRFERLKEQFGGDFEKKGGKF